MDFKFLSSTENEIRFDGLTLVKIGDKTCKCIVKISEKATGKSKDVEILYHREQE